MNNKQTPSWLESMQNGSIGEARTRAFLIDTFWILERSVDIEGADFLIQQRVSLEKLMKRDPLKLGIVQSKYFANSKTTMTIKEEYLLDEHGLPADIFFLLCHTGKHDSQKMFFLSSNDIIKNFKTSQANPSVYRVPGKKLLEGEFEVTSKAAVLNRIDSTLAHAQFLNGMRYVNSFFGHDNPDEKNIKPEYVEPLPNNWGDIPKYFYELKETASKGIWDLEEAAEILHKIVVSDDPQEALGLAEDFDSDYSDRRGYRNYSVSISGDLWDEDFYETVKKHLEKLRILKETNNLDKILRIRSAVVDKTFEELSKLSSPPKDPLNIELKLNPSSFMPMQTIVKFSKSVKKNKFDVSSGLLVSSYPYFHHIKDDNKWRTDITQLAEDVGTHSITELVNYFTESVKND